jgi:hypothetical protein
MFPGQVAPRRILIAGKGLTVASGLNDARESQQGCHFSMRTEAWKSSRVTDSIRRKLSGLWPDLVQNAG